MVTEKQLRNTFFDKFRTSKRSEFSMAIQAYEDADEGSATKTLEYLVKTVSKWVDRKRLQKNREQHHSATRASTAAAASMGAPVAVDASVWDHEAYGDGSTLDGSSHRGARQRHRSRNRNGAPTSNLAVPAVGGIMAPQVPGIAAPVTTPLIPPSRARAPDSEKGKGKSYKDKPCRFFNLGRCSYSDLECDRAHRAWTPEEKEESDSWFASRGGKAGKGKGKGKGKAKGRSLSVASDGSQGARGEEPPTPRGSATGCWEWEARGTCKFGEHCRYPHHPRGTGSVPATPRGSASASSTQVPGAHCVIAVAGPIDCAPDGGCDYGSIGGGPGCGIPPVFSAHGMCGATLSAGCGFGIGGINHEHGHELWQ
jgi:hypothetical protein